MLKPEAKRINWRQIIHRSLRALAVVGVSMFLVAVLAGLISPPVRAEPDRPASETNRLLVDRLAASSAITLDVPILMYHHIGGHFLSPYNISTPDFAAQMAYLARHGYSIVSVDQVAAALRGQFNLPACPVAITFDDGYAEQYNNALPILQQHNFHATFYLVTGYISLSHAFMNWDQITDLIGQGNWIGSHTYSHAFVGRLAGSELRHQIVDAKTKLESGLGMSVTTFSYPFGSYSLAARRLISDTGFTSAVWLGAAYRQSSDRIYKLYRIAVYSGSLLNFALHLPHHQPDGSGLCPLN